MNKYLVCILLQSCHGSDSLLADLHGCHSAGSCCSDRDNPSAGCRSVFQVEVQPADPPRCTASPTSLPRLSAAQQRSPHPRNLQTLAAQSWLRKGRKARKKVGRHRGGWGVGRWVFGETERKNKSSKEGKRNGGDRLNHTTRRQKDLD